MSQFSANASTDKLPRVLIIYYSFSAQTAGLVKRLTSGLEEQGVQVTVERLVTHDNLRFPIGTVLSTIKMMVITLFRRRITINELSDVCRQEYDLVILGGPTWSYNPSGPVLSLLDRDGRTVFRDRTVLPLISCRGYWRQHWFGLKTLLKKCGANVENCMVFSHPSQEPWRTIGVFLKLAGKNPERSRLIGRFYKKFGHSRDQMDEAWRFGLQIGEALRRKSSLVNLNFRTKLSLP